MRGNSLITTVLWLALVATLGFVMAGLSVQHLNASTLQENRQQALQLARSACSLGLARLAQDTRFGAEAPGGGLLEVPGGGRLTFDPDLAASQGLLASTNNLEGANSVQGAEGRTVPSHSALLIGEGRCGGVVRRVEVVLGVPPFPYALAAAGAITARRGVTVAGVQKKLVAPLSPTELLVPAHLLSNDGSPDAVFLGPGTNITGDAQAVGQVQLDPSAAPGTIHVQGRVRSGAAAQKIPRINVANYDPQAGDAAFTTLAAATDSGAAVLSGAFRRQGDLTITGGLKLDGGLLYVHGNLTVGAGITGKGLVAATGNITVRGQSDFRSGNGVAMLAGKNLTISGSGATGSYFQGLLYTEGTLDADHVTLLGSLIAADEHQVTLEEARVVHEKLPPPSGEVRVELPEDYSGDIDGQHYRLHFRESPPGTWVMDILEPVPKTQVLGSDPDAIHTAIIDGVCYDKPQPSFLQLATLFADDVMSAATLLPAGGGGPSSLLISDPSQFLHLSDRVRVLLWKES